ncbi:MAG: hypothetical protein ACXACC_10535 [Promethearchaeota archaeon]|jgi:YHS domain-containing protein
MDENIKEEKKCPICDMVIRSDATIHKYCKLCGMGILNPSKVPKHLAKDGKTDYFCCDKCLSIYKKK